MDVEARETGALLGRIHRWLVAAVRSDDRCTVPGPPGVIALAGLRVAQIGDRFARRLAAAIGRVAKRKLKVDYHMNRQAANEEDAGKLAALLDDLKPRFGLLLTSLPFHALSMGAIFVPLEAYLSFPNLRVLGLPDVLTALLAILIGFALWVGVEAVAPMLVYAAEEAGGERKDKQRRSFYYVIAGLVGAVLLFGGYSLYALQHSRERNTQIEQQIEQPGGQPATGFEGASAPAVEAPAAAAAETEKPDLSFALPLQAFALLVGLVLALRFHEARDYRKTKFKERRKRLLVIWHRLRLQIARTKLVLASVPLDRIERKLAHRTSAEWAWAAYLIDRLWVEHARAAAEQGEELAGLPHQAPPAVEEYIHDLLAPYRASVSQPDVAEAGHVAVRRAQLLDSQNGGGPVKPD